MSDERRRRIQLRLSTMVAVTLTAGVILWANSIWKDLGQEVVDSVFYPGILMNDWEQVRKEGLGWPTPFLHRQFSSKLNKYYRTKIDPLNLIIDAAIAFLILASVAILLEIAGRRRKRVPRE